jgi:hypothetical protein
MTTSDSAALRQALYECLDELEAAIGLLAKGGLIPSVNIGKKKRDGFRAILAEGEPKTLRERLMEPGMQKEIAALVASGSVKCRCGREVNEHYWVNVEGDTECSGFVADLSQPWKDMA